MSAGAVVGTIIGVLALIFAVLWIYRKGAQDDLPTKILMKSNDDDTEGIEIASPMHK